MELLVPFLQRLWYDAVLDWRLNPGPPALEASTLPLGSLLLYVKCYNFPFNTILTKCQLYHTPTNTVHYLFTHVLTPLYIVVFPCESYITALTNTLTLLYVIYTILPILGTQVIHNIQYDIHIYVMNSLGTEDESFQIIVRFTI